MAEGLTERQRQVLEFIKQEIRQKGYPPSVREIGEAIGLSSSSTVHGHLSRLEDKGYIRRDPTKPRAIEVLEENPEAPLKRVVNVPMVGRVTAGEPILATQNVDDHFPLPYDFVQEDDDIFFLTVDGESMIEAGIHDGDYVLVRRQVYAANGQIVVAMIDDEATVKRFFKEGGRVRLQPENHSMAPIYANDVTILGKVIGLVRRIVQ